MCKPNPITLGIALTLTLAGAGFAQENPAEKTQKQLLLNQAATQQAKLNEPIINLAIHYIGENATRRYALSESAAEQLEASLFESVIAVSQESEQEKNFLRELANPPSTSRFLVRILSYPACRTDLAKHLSPQQLQDLEDRANARERRDKEAISGHLVALLDYQLGLTPVQHQRFEPTILADTKQGDWERTSGDMLWTDETGSFDRVRGLSLNGMVSPAQARIYTLLISEFEEENRRHEDLEDPDQREVQLKATTEEIIKMERAGKISREDIGPMIEEAKRRIWADSDLTTSTPRVKPEDRPRLIAEAKLAAYTEQLGELDARASKRLELVAKGAVERYIENQDKPRNADRNVAHVATTTSAARTAPAPMVVTNYPLYQQTIKTVLSEEAFAKHQANQAERVSYRHRALRALLVATLDTRLLLSDKQRARIETDLAAIPLPESGLVNGYQVLGRFILQINPDDMREWQQPFHRKIVEETEWVRGEGR